MSDLARNRSELASLINTLKFNEDDKPIGLEALDAWPWGGIAYRPRWSKLRTERLVPHSADTSAEHDSYVAHRAK
jgi:hypothetical protein